ncbi:MAG: hypothetical protein LUD29_00695 [Clostridia bacterium]|nr:hypothetical protein [Clostridia bacterium]
MEDDPEEQSAWDIMMGLAHEKKAPGIEFVRKLFEILRNRYQIEDCFRALKHNFVARPIYHYRPSRIDPHFLLCYTALLVERLLQKKLLEKNLPMTLEELLITIRRLRVLDIDGIYHSTYTGGDTLRDLINLTGIELNKAKYKPTTLYKMINKLIA